MVNSNAKDFGSFKITRDGRALVSDAHLLELVRQEMVLSGKRALSSDKLVVPTSFETATKRYSTL